MTTREKDELAKVMAELIRSNRAVHEALLDWAAFNPHIDFRW